jgi:hypothetical protein
VNRPVFQENGAGIVARACGDGVGRFDAFAARNVDHRDARKLSAHGHPAFGA